MKLLFLSTGIGYGGAYKIFVWLMNQIVAEGHEVTLLTYRSDKVIQYQFIDDRVRLLHMPLESRGGSLRGCLKTVMTLRKHIQDEAYDIGVAFLPPSQIRLILACKGTRTKSLISQRGDPWNSINTKSPFIPKAIINGIINHADAYVFQTPYAKAYYPEIVRRKCIIIQNPVIQFESRTNRIPEKRIVSVARFDIRQKRQDVLINAFKTLSTSYPDYTLELYGNGEDENLLKETTKSNEKIKFMGVSNNISKAISNAAMFVLTSDSEGIPNALLEAMSLGIPCISTDYSPGGVELLIKDGVDGLIVKRGDSAGLVTAMSRYLDDEKFAEMCGLNGQKRVTAVSDNEIAKMWTDYFVKICNTNK